MKFDVYKVLSYGAIGLSCILAFLAYYLLSKEQARPKPRKEFLISIYIFMSFLIILAVIGLIAEYSRERLANTSAGELTKQLEASNSRNTEVLTKLTSCSTEQEGLKKEIERLKKDNEDKSQKLTSIEQKVSGQDKQLATVSAALLPLMEQKNGKVTRLTQLDPANSSYQALITEITNDLKSIDDSIKKIIKQ